MIGLNDLLAYRVEEVLESPPLRKACKDYCAQLFYGGNLLRGCDSSIRQYFRRLQLEGIETLNKKIMTKYNLKKDVVLTFNGQVYNSATMTDEIAEAYLAQFPKGARHFDVKGEKAEAPAEIPAEAPKAKKGSKAKK